MRAGNVPIRFSDGKVRMIPADKVKVVQAEFPDAVLVERPKTMMGRPLVSSIAQGVSDWAPTVGGIGGSLAGGSAGGAAGAAIGALGGPPGIAAGAGIGALIGRQVGGMAGGAVGQGAREATYAAAGNDAPGSVGQEVRNQAILGVIGEGGSALARGAGAIGVRAGLPARVADARKAVGEMIRERLPVGGFEGGLMGKIISKGSVKAGKNLSKKTLARDAANIAAGKAGVEIQSGPLEKKMLDMADEYAMRGDRSTQLSALARRMDDFVQTWKAGKLSPQDAQKYLSSLDEEAKQLWKAEKERGAYIPEAERRAAQQAKQIAGVLRAEFRKLVPNHRVRSEGVSSAASALDAIKAAEHQGMLSIGSRLATGSALGAGADFLSGERHPGRLTTGAAAGAALMASPSLLSRGGLALTDPRVLEFLRQFPRAYRGEGE